MPGHLGIVAAIDDLFRRVAEEPSAWGEEAQAEWLAETAAWAEGDKEILRALRRAARLSGRLARYWSDPERAERRPADWRQAVDAALGSRGWEPSLSVAMAGLEREPSPVLFFEVARRWRQVHFAAWMEGVSFEEWLAGR